MPLAFPVSSIWSSPEIHDQGHLFFFLYYQGVNSILAYSLDASVCVLGDVKDGNLFRLVLCFCLILFRVWLSRYHNAP